VGLRLLLCPLGSNIVVRTACCSVGIALPVYSTFKAIETRNENEQQRWLTYWAAYGTFTIAEVFTDKFISWFPLYYHMKFAFLVWLQLPSVDGANNLYVNHLRPFLLKHQARLDQIVGFFYSEMTKFTSAHQTQLQFARALLMKALRSANQMVSHISHPVQRQANSAIEGPARVEAQASSEIEGPTNEAHNSESENDG
ncbi:HVA22-like protein, partial [Actinidia chinensis var. chinensis]